jgi:hypothetical protein
VLEDVEAQGDIKWDITVSWDGLHEVDAPAPFRRYVPQCIRRDLETYQLSPWRQCLGKCGQHSTGTTTYVTYAARYEAVPAKHG